MIFTNYNLFDDTFVDTRPLIKWSFLDSQASSLSLLNMLSCFSLMVCKYGKYAFWVMYVTLVNGS